MRKTSVEGGIKFAPKLFALLYCGNSFSIVQAQKEVVAIVYSKWLKAIKSIIITFLFAESLSTFSILFISIFIVRLCY